MTTANTDSIENGTSAGVKKDATPTPTTTTTTTKTTTTKILYLIRHAESEENRRLRSFVNVIKTFGRLSIPSYDDVTSSLELLNIPGQIDSSISVNGQKQIDYMKNKIGGSAHFLQQEQIDMVVHSPLERARETSRGMLQCCENKAENTIEYCPLNKTNDDGPSSKPEKVNARVVETGLLLEKTPTEWIPGMYDSFETRIQDFQRWVLEQPQERIAVVGHSQYFKAMLNLDFKFGNCDIWKVELSSSSSTPINVVDDDAGGVSDNDSMDDTMTTHFPPALPRQFSNLRRLYQCDYCPSPSAGINNSTGTTATMNKASTTSTSSKATTSTTTETESDTSSEQR